MRAFEFLIHPFSTASSLFRRAAGAVFSISGAIVVVSVFHLSCSSPTSRRFLLSSVGRSTCFHIHVCIVGTSVAGPVSHLRSQGHRKGLRRHGSVPRRGRKRGELEPRAVGEVARN
jgi:hypothetical protein